MANNNIQKLDKLSYNCVVMFNLLAKQIGEHILSEFPKNEEFYMYNQLITDIIKKNVNEPISVFLEYIYQNEEYRNSILESDENFFRANQHENLTSSDKDKIRAMFQFKSCWDKMNKESQDYIKQAMIQLVKVCERYLSLRCNMVNLKK
ncbi:hypothetical protein BMW23_0406 [Bodo saltans virus]|jgi:hypothetical protein|uniref:Uncharacterized protein n=1 Tax=Bodo saltans virus TaxID=2024608 RepID=A0A2H4UU51_9VIRU|nr:hypothetical protein QJ851_gp0397 [Bodo saltans virus]ATZ80460.1 hypothetical protein BMW23_0406 [Bodo saltans virus]